MANQPQFEQLNQGQILQTGTPTQTQRVSLDKYNVWQLHKTIWHTPYGFVLLQLPFQVHLSVKTMYDSRSLQSQAFIVITENVSVCCGYSQRLSIHQMYMNLCAKHRDLKGDHPH